MRPLPITILCLVLFLVGCTNLISTFQNPSDYSYLLIFAVSEMLLLLVSVVGLWNMKRWSAYIFLIARAAVPFLFLTMFPEQVGSGNVHHNKLLLSLGVTSYFHMALFSFGIMTALYCAVVLPYWRRLT